MTIDAELAKDHLPTGDPLGRHWLKPAGRTWTPPVVAFFDTETIPQLVGDAEVQRLRLWCASVVVRRHRTASRVGAVSGRGHTGAELAAFLTAELGRHESAWLFAHNLGFDLTTSRLLDRLGELGWALRSVAMTGKSAIIRMARGKTNLCLCDSYSWFQAPLADVGALVETEKPPLPDFADEDGVWFARCAADVAILEAAVLELLAWWERSDLGHFSVTGPGCAFSTVRRRLRPFTIMADPDPAVRRFERRGLHGGRRDLTTWGEQVDGPWVHLDFEMAYPTLAGRLELPCVPQGWVEPHQLPDLADPPEHEGYMAEVTISTDRPRYPARLGADVVLPVGTFRTILAGPELTLAARRGDVVRVHRARKFWTYPALTEWSEWIRAVCLDRETGEPGIARLAAKGWSRSGLGKFAGRTSQSSGRGPAWSVGWSAARGWDAHVQAPALLIELCGQRLWMVRDLETMTAVPAIFAWVESACRLRLRAVLDALGEDTWVQADTDGLLASVPALRKWLRSRGIRIGERRTPMQVAARVCDQLLVECAPLIIRPKEMYHHLETIGPQHVHLGSGRKLSGVRTDSTSLGTRTWEGRTWPGLLWQMEHGDRTGYVRPKAIWHLPAITAHRWALETGSLAPLEARLSPDGSWELVPWAETTLAASGAILAPDQWERLAGRW